MGSQSPTAKTGRLVIITNERGEVVSTGTSFRQTGPDGTPIGQLQQREAKLSAWYKVIETYCGKPFSWFITNGMREWEFLHLTDKFCNFHDWKVQVQEVEIED